MTDQPTNQNAASEGTSESPCSCISLSDLERIGEEHDRKMDSAFEHDAALGYITLKIAYPYHIELARIASKADLLGWTLHLCHKTWMDTEHLAEFIERVCKIKGWKHKSL